MSQIKPTEENLVDLCRGLLTISEVDNETEGQATELLDLLSNGGTLGDASGLDEKDLELLYSMAFTFYNNGKYDKALPLFEFINMMDHLSTKYRMGLGATQQSLGNYEKAVEAYGYCTILDIDDPKPQLQAGYCLMKLERYEEATLALEGAVLSSTQHPAIAVQAEALLENIARLTS